MSAVIVSVSALRRAFSRDYPSFRLVQTSYSGGWWPANFVSAASTVRPGREGAMPVRHAQQAIRHIRRDSQ